MYEQLISEIQAQAKRLSDLQRSGIEKIQSLNDGTGNAISFSIPISDGDRSLSDLDTLSSTLVKFSEGFNNEKNWNFVPRTWLNDFAEALKNTANSFDNLKGSIESIDAQHGGLASIDASNLNVTTKSGTIVELRKILSNINLNVDKTFEVYYRIRPAISAPRLSEFSELFSIFSTRRTQFDSLSRELTSLAERGRESAQFLKVASDAARTIQTEVTRLKDEVEKDRKSSSEYAVESSQKLEAIRAANKGAEELSASVTSYQATFSQFQNQLDARNNAYEAQKTAFNELKESLDEKTNEVQRLTKQAEDMLKGATNAGLAGSYSQKQQSTDAELKKARLAYYISIVLLVFLTLPIFFYSFPREFIAEMWKLIFHTDVPAVVAGSAPKTFEEHLINIIGRAVFLIPGFLFLRFASTRHAQLFRLREDYSYKYSIAASVEGFMKQAKGYADEIAATSYYELTHNPAERMDHKSDDSKLPNPIMEKLLSKIEGFKIKRD